jgi:hypothetical protein
MNEIAPLAIVTPAPAALPVGAVTVVRMSAELAGMAADMILTGVVIGREPGGQTVIRTQYGALTLKGGALPMGGTVTLQLRQTGTQTQVVILSIDGGSHAAREALTAGAAPMPMPMPLQTPTATATSGDVVRMLTGHWDALAEALRAAPELARQVPRPGPEMAAAALGLIALLKRGGVGDWLGREELRSLPAPLARHLGDDFVRMARLADADPNSWRFVPLPLLHNGRLDQALLFAHGGHRHGDDAIDDAGMRLMLEIEHPRHGRMQIDALVRPHRFDLIVRSHVELPLALREKLAAVHAEARDIASLAGAIGFQWTGAFVAPPLTAEHLGLTA